MLWQLRQLKLINIIAIIVSGVWLILHQATMQIPGPFLLLPGTAVHCAAVVWTLGRATSRHTGFLHVQGLTRDQIWWHTFTATLISGGMVVLISAVIILSGLRAWVQDVWIESPYFLVPVSSENWIPLILVLHYAFILPLMHYVWIRANQPFRGTTAGWMMMSLGLCFYLWSFAMAEGHRSSPRFLIIVALTHIPAIAMLIVSCNRIHRTLEVRS